MTTRAIRGLAACLLLPLALLACGDGEEEPATDMFGREVDEDGIVDEDGEPGVEAGADEATTPEETVAPTPPDDLALPDVCTLIPAGSVETTMGGTIAQTVPAVLPGGERFGGSAYCGWTIAGTAHALTLTVWPQGTPPPTEGFPTLEGVSGGVTTTVEAANDLWRVELTTTFVSDPGRDVQGDLGALGAEVLARLPTDD